MDLTQGYEYLTDRDLMASLLEGSIDEIEGDTVSDIIHHLLKGSSVPEKVLLVKEIATRYGARKLQRGEPFSCASQIYDHYKAKLGEEMQEHFHVVVLDNKHRVITERLITLGTLNQSLVHPREVFAPAIELRAAAIVLVHNHPSGDPTPSNQDVAITQRLADVGDIVGIKVLDHVVIAHNGFFSFVDENLMP